MIARDEEDRIDACLASLAFCDELLVVDARSGDRTRERAAAHGARVVEREWPGFGPQKRFATREARHDWVLCLDADERVSSDLRREIEALRAGGFAGPGAWEMPRRSRYLGRWIRHGTWHPDRQLRLFDRRLAGWSDAPVHERVHARGAVGRLRGPLLHEPYRDLREHLRTVDRYAHLSAGELARRGRRARLHDLALRPLGRFLRSYLLRAGVLDGWRGLLLALVAAHGVGLKYARLRALQARTDMSREAA